MNGRVYDPLTAQFFSPDPYVQSPGNWLNYNRYSYCINNPFKYTDPTGEVFGVDDAIVVLAMMYFGGVQANFFTADNPMNPADWNWSSGKTYIGIASGAMGGLGMVGIPVLPQIPGILANGALQTGMQVVINGIGNLIDGNNFFQGWYYAAGMGFVSGIVPGYELAKENGLNYWWGTKVMHGRTQWSLFTSELPIKSVEFPNIKYNSATADNTCVPQTLSELEAAKGGSRTETDFRQSTGWTEKGVMIGNSPESQSQLLKNQGFSNQQLDTKLVEDATLMQGLSDRGYNVVLSHKDGVDMRHWTTINKINYYESGNINLYGRGRVYNLNSLMKNLMPWLFLIK